MHLKKGRPRAQRSVDMPISSCARAFLEIRPYPGPFRHGSESDKVATSALCSDQAAYLPAKPHLSVLSHSVAAAPLVRSWTPA
jgi:hypothetical protein